jgi:aminopeptidase N
LQQTFEASSGRDLREFFRQWVTRPGAPSISVASVRRIADRPAQDELRVVLRQSADYRLRVPVRVELVDGRTVDAIVDMTGAEGRAAIALPARAVSMTVDPDTRVFRRVAPEEIAPILREVMLDPATRVVTGADPQVRQAALVVAQAALEQGVRTLDAAAAARTMEPLFVAAAAAELAAVLGQLGLPPVPDALAKSRAAFAYAGRTSAGRRFIVVSAPDADAMRALARPLPHLGGQSYAVFDGARSVSRGVWPAPVRRIPVAG